MAGTVTQDRVELLDKALEVLTFSWTSDADGDATADSDLDIGGWIFMVVTNPGATAPSADYDVVLNDDDGCDVLGGEGADRHTSTTEQITPKIGNAYGERFVNGVLSLVISDAGNAKIGETIVYIRRR